MYATIATWQMANAGSQEALNLLSQNQAAADALETLIQNVEANPDYLSVGYGGLPNEEGILELDAAFMDGDTMAQGAVAGIQNVFHPISVARKLSHDHYNSFRVGAGATKYAAKSGFELRNLLTKKAKQKWEKQLAEQSPQFASYDGHDTVGAITLDANNSMAAGTSTSGLFMKKAGRIGDSPLSGSGFYVDSNVGGAIATGLGEDIMKGCLSYEIVRRIEQQQSPQTACDQAVYPFVAKLQSRYGKVGEISVIALDCHGNWGVATNVEFTFCVGDADHDVQVYHAEPGPKQTTIINPLK